MSKLAGYTCDLTGTAVTGKDPEPVTVEVTPKLRLVLTAQTRANETAGWEQGDLGPAAGAALAEVLRAGAAKLVKDGGK